MLRKSPTTTKPKAAPKNEKYVTPKEAAEILSVSVRTIWNWASDPRKKQAGFPTAIRLSKSATRFPRSEIQAFAEAMRAA